MKLISSFYSVDVIKNIPVFSGLGGGTSNAAFILKFLLKDKITKNIFDEVEKLIGSDLRLFFYKTGFLENLKTIKIIKKQKLFFLLSRPNINCSTHKIYSKIKRYSKKTKLEFHKMNTKKKFITHISSQKNELQSIVEKKYPIIKTLLIDISSKKGCLFSRMSGSGATCFGLFEFVEDASEAELRLRTDFPEWWVASSKLSICKSELEPLINP